MGKNDITMIRLVGLSEVMLQTGRNLQLIVEISRVSAFNGGTFTKLLIIYCQAFEFSFQKSQKSLNLDKIRSTIPTCYKRKMYFILYFTLLSFPYHIFINIIPPYCTVLEPMFRGLRNLEFTRKWELPMNL